MLTCAHYNNSPHFSGREVGYEYDSGAGSNFETVQRDRRQRMVLEYISGLSPNVRALTVELCARDFSDLDVVVPLGAKKKGKEKGKGKGKGKKKEKRHAATPLNAPGLQIAVRNLPWTISSDDLRQIFEQIGTVVQAETVCHGDTGRSKGWGTVLFETKEEAHAAIQGFNGIKLSGRPMQITFHLGAGGAAAGVVPLPEEV